MADYELSPEELSDVFDDMVQTDGFQFPHDLFPGENIGGNVHLGTREHWEGYDYNPPEYFQNRDHPFAVEDPTADAKPTWDQILERHALLTGKNQRLSFRLEVMSEETRRIRAVYIGDLDVPQTEGQEILYRIRASAADLVEKDTERDRLHRVAVSLGKQTQIMPADQLDDFDPTDDALWAKPKET